MKKKKQDFFGPYTDPSFRICPPAGGKYCRKYQSNFKLYQ